MEAFARHPDAAARSIAFLEPDEVRACNPAVRGQVEGALHCTEDAVVEPRQALRRPAGAHRGAARGPLPLPPAVPGRPRRAATRSSTRPARAGRATSPSWPPAPPTTTSPAPRRWRPVSAGSGCRCSQTAPFAARLTTSLADADSLRYYPAYEAAPLAELGDQTPLAAAHHLQLLLVQRPDGGLTIGDTHAYEEPFDFALCEDPTDELLARARRILGAELPPVRRRWEGIVRAVRRRRRLPARGDRAGRVVGDGPGRARHDVRAGHRRRHPAGGGSGGSGRVIGRFALVCLDMAGTTVRDDGAVEAAFTSALAAVGVTPGSRVLRGGRGPRAPDHGLVQGGRVRRAVRADEAREATAAFAAAYEAIVAAGDVGEIPGARAGAARPARRRASRSASPPASPPRPATRCSMPWAGAPTIDLALSPADVGRGRPAPDLILGAMERLGVDDPGAVAVVGDTVSDLEAGARGRGRCGGGRPERRPRRGDARGRSPTAVIADVTGLIALLGRA